MNAIQAPSARRSDRRRTRPGLESLEGRRVLSTFTVSNLADSGAGSLRQAIVGADGASDGATINFNSGLAGTISLKSALPELTNTHGMTLVGHSGVKVDLSLAKLGDGNSIYVSSLGSATIDNLEFDNAPARAFENLGTLTLNGVTVAGSHNGAAVNYGTMVVLNSTIKNNAAVNFGGGINNYAGSLAVQNSTFTGNSATYGGAIFNNARLAVSGSVFQNNLGGVGGAIWDIGTAQMTIDSSTISYNTSRTFGGGIIVVGQFAPKLTNDNIYQNVAPNAADIDGPVASTSSNNVIGTGSGMTGIADNNPYTRTDGKNHPTYNAAKPTNFVGTDANRIRPVMWQEVKFDGATVDYYYTVRTNTATLTVTLDTAPSAWDGQTIHIGTVTNDQLASEHPNYPTANFPVALSVYRGKGEDTDNGGSINLWQGYDATQLQLPRLAVTANSRIVDSIAHYVDSTGTDLHTWKNP